MNNHKTQNTKFVLRILGEERIDEIKQRVMSNISNNHVDVDTLLEQVFFNCATVLERVQYEPPLYFGTPIGELEGDKLKHFRLRLGVPQKIDGEWYTLPTVEEMQSKYSHWLYKNRGGRSVSAIEWISDPVKFGQFLKVGGAKANTLFQDQLKELDPAGLEGLRNYYKPNWKRAAENLRSLIPKRDVREESLLDIKNGLMAVFDIKAMLNAKKMRAIRK